MISYKKYNLILIFIGITPAVLLVLLNYVIDPFQIFQTNFFDDVGQTQERYLKIELLKKDKTFNTFLLGGSRMGTTNPEDIDSMIPGVKTYNLFVSSGNQYDNLLHSKWLIKNNPNIKHIYVQVDWPESFGPVRKELQYLTHPEVIGESDIGFLNKYLFTVPMEAIKFKLLNNFSRQGEFKLPIEKGYFYYPKKDSLIQTDCREYTAGIPDFNKNFSESVESKEQYQINQKALEAISNLLVNARNNSIKVDIFITPHNHKFLDKINLNEYLFFLTELSKITSYWNFAFYSEITNNDCNYYESSHYTAPVGKLIFKTILLNHGVTNYSRRVTKDNIHFERIFIKNNFTESR